MMLTALLVLITFTSAAFGDIVEAYFVRAVTDMDPDRAACMSVAMYLNACIVWVLTIKVSLWYCLPEVAGLFMGTRFAISRQRRARERDLHMGRPVA